MKIIGLILLLALPFLALGTTHQRLQCDAKGVSNQFDLYFMKASEKYLPRPYNWCHLKAQCYRESALRKDAVSPVGAMGVCQFMPGTWKDYGHGDVKNPKKNIEASARYMARLINGWIYDRPPACRLRLAQGSYNAGFGHILQAQVESGGQRCWRDISPYLERVTGHHSVETINYVERIEQTYSELRTQ